MQLLVFHGVSLNKNNPTEILLTSIRSLIPDHSLVNDNLNYYFISLEYSKSVSSSFNDGEGASMCRCMHRIGLKRKTFRF